MNHPFATNRLKKYTFTKIKAIRWHPIRGTGSSKLDGKTQNVTTTDDSSGADLTIGWGIYKQVDISLGAVWFGNTTKT